MSDEIVTSPSDINLWKAEPALALIKHHFGLRSVAGPKAIRGTAVHTAAQKHMMGEIGFSEANNLAHAVYEQELANLRQETGGMVFDDENEAREDLYPMLDNAVQCLSSLEYNPQGVEAYYSTEVEGLTLRGYVDFDYPDYQLDLKTGQRAYTKPTPDHLTQLACYWGMTKMPQRIAYVTPKKFHVCLVPEWELSAEWELVKRLCRKIRILKEMPFEQARDLCPPQDMAGFRWDGPTSGKAIEIWELAE